MPGQRHWPGTEMSIHPESFWRVGKVNPYNGVYPPTTDQPLADLEMNSHQPNNKSGNQDGNLI